MPREPTTHSFENLPEPMLAAAVRIGSGIACLHGDPEPPRRFSAAEREESRRQALAGIPLSREQLDEIGRVLGADRRRASRRQ